MKYIAYYFSSSICNPCTVFTPKLIKLYTKYQERDCDIIFVPWDDKSDEEYANKMPWLKMEYSEECENLKKKYNINTMPNLVIVEKETDTLMTKCGRNLSLIDPNLYNFPWNNEDLFGNLTNLYKENKVYNNSELFKLKYIILFFGNLSHQTLYNKLLTEFNKTRRKKISLDCIYLSYDNTYTQMIDMLEDSPFIYLSYESPLQREYIYNICDVPKVPSVILLNMEESSVVNITDNILQNKLLECL